LDRVGLVARGLLVMSLDAPQRLGAIIEWPEALLDGRQPLAAWWSEEPGFLLEVDPRVAPRLLREAGGAGIAAIPIGQVRSEPTLVDRRPGGVRWSLPLADIEPAYRNALGRVWHLEESPLVEVSK
jgi:hypothetical protein